jgi:ubiquinol-cytochrome c reductase cytochrome c subunit
MPVFGPDAIDEHALASIVRYVGYLRAPEDRGGLGLGHLGPIPEGFVAWVVGLGLLVVALRWIGTRD